MKRTKIKDIQIEKIGQPLLLKGWVKTLRAQKEFSFLELSDGSTLSGIQVVLQASLSEYESLLPHLSTGTSIAVEGLLVQSPQGHKQAWELRTTKLQILGACNPETYPLQKKRHSFEFLRSLAHLRPRTNTQ